jgi:ectoine hydroxylase-related dioxygenase (phytanoyl-CoA dioxygenase family)
MQLTTDGAQLFQAAFAPTQVAGLALHFDRMDRSRPGKRLGLHSGLADLVTPATAIARDMLGPQAQPVRATFFDKSPVRNWSLGWHQDRTIAVRERRDVPGFSRWTLKSGIHHAVPPPDLLARMLTLRIHLDPVDEHNAPLLIAPGSHRLGVVAEPEISAAVSRCGTHACLAQSGDVWVYSTLILHASEASRSPRRRRVLQLLYSADKLPGGLKWLGI